MASDANDRPKNNTTYPKDRSHSGPEGAQRSTRNAAGSKRSPSSSNTEKIQGVLIGELAELTGTGEARVNFAGNLELLPVPARSTSELSPADIGRAVALMFEGGDRRKPIIMGLMQHSESTPNTDDAQGHGMQQQAGDTDDAPRTAPSVSLPVPDDVEVDGQRLDLEAKEQIVLRCGKASITLTSAGKVIIRGAYISTRSSGANRIKGGSVQIN